MPKATKKKKEKAADFSKAKLKLGKGKQLPANQVDTSFKARSIALPQQSISVQKDESEPTTRRKLTFNDLIAHLKHHNAVARRDAVLGLRELFQGHPGLIEPFLTTLVSACVRIIGDDDASVRKALLSFFGWLLPQIPTQNLAPHSPVLLLFTTSAQTHIFPEIQIDAVRFLDIYLDLIPDVVVGGWRDGKGGHGKRVLEGYLGILSAGTKFGEDGDIGPVQATSTASVVLSTASKLVVLRSLAKFLRLAFAAPHPSGGENYASSSKAPTPTWYLASSFVSANAYQAFDALLQPKLQSRSPIDPPTRRWQAEVDPEDDAENFLAPVQPELVEVSWRLQDLTENLSTPAGLQGLLHAQDDASQTDYDARLARTLHPVLLSAFLDCSPAVFSLSSGPPEFELGTILAVADMYRTIYGALMQKSQVESNKAPNVDGLQTILGRMAIYFPFSLSAIVRRDIKTEQAFQDLNLVFCELTSVLVLAVSATSSIAARKKPQRKPETACSNALVAQVERVSEYVVRLLKGEPSTSDSLSRHITAQGYIALLPTTWSLLNAEAVGQSETFGDVLEATLDHAMRISSSSAIKRLSVEFLSRLVLLETDPRYTGSFKIARRAQDVEKFEQWVLQLPKALWELGDKDIGVTEATFIFLLRLFQRRSSLVHAKLAEPLASRFTPYFAITHPTRGELPGPFARLELPALRRLALDAMVSISSRAGGDPRRSLDSAIQKAVRGTDQEAYWMEVKSTLPASPE